jgi:transketolase
MPARASLWNRLNDRVLELRRMQNPREIYGRTLVEIGRENPNIVVLEADLGKSTMSCYFEQAFPERFFEMGIAEANMTSFAAGLSLTGKIPFTNSFAVFAAGRAFDQIRQGICIPGLNVRIIGSSCGLSDFGDGSTHQSVEDVAIMRAIPNMTVLVPADGNETRTMTRALSRYQGPVYMRITRNDLPDVMPENGPFEVGKPHLIRQGNDVAVFANGQMVSLALAAAEMLAAEGTSLRVVNVSSMKPADMAALAALADAMKGVVTAEEHSLIGGLATLIREVIQGRSVPMKAIGIDDRFGQSARNYDDLLQGYGLTAAHIAAAVRQCL